MSSPGPINPNKPNQPNEIELTNFAVVKSVSEASTPFVGMPSATLRSPVLAERDILTYIRSELTQFANSFVKFMDILNEKYPLLLLAYVMPFHVLLYLYLKKPQETPPPTMKIPIHPVEEDLQPKESIATVVAQKVTGAIEHLQPKKSQ